MPRLPIITAALLLTMSFLSVLVQGEVVVSSDELRIRQHVEPHASTSDPMVGMDMEMTEAEDEDDSNDSPPLPPPTPPHGHDHGGHTPPKTELDDASIHYWHHFPPSYLAADFRLTPDSAIFGEEFDEDWDPDNASGHKVLLVLHVAGMMAAYFVALPISLALRAANSPTHYLANTTFLVITALGWLAGVSYSAATPDRYEGGVHGSFGNWLVLLSVGLAVLDSLGLISRAVAFYRSGDRSWSGFKSNVLRGEERWLTGIKADHRYEMIGLMGHEDHEVEHRHVNGRQKVIFAIGDGEDEEHDEEHHHEHHRRPDHHISPHLHDRSADSPTSRDSLGSDHTLHEHSPHLSVATEHKRGSRSGAYDIHDYHAGSSSHSPTWSEPVDPPAPKMTMRSFGEIALTWVRRTQVVLAYVVTLIGFTTYLGMCRGSFINACAAHFIKGSIFFGYGVLTFARYLGAYADLGWAWNRRPGGVFGASAEMVECSVIFLYGITNTWMERFGAHAGDPYTVKQVQHISIAVMFWFAGLTGILLESRRVRRILGTIIGRQHDNQEPPSYAFSFNPLPGLVIAVTGLAMAAHHQDYEFQISIHTLWGILLAGGSAFRFLTYFFLWIRPPVESTLPSRPPTEILTSFGWAAGGIVFMLSVEEVSYAAMRAGYDDMMAFLNFTVALTSLVFCWIVVVMLVKGMATLRQQSSTKKSQVGDEEERR